MRIPLITALIVAFGLLLVCKESGAQSRTEEDYPVRSVAVTEIEGEVGLEYNYFGETIRRTSTGRTRFSNHYVQEYFLGRLDGYAYHPKFIDFSGELKLGLSHQTLRRSSDIDGTSTSRDDSALLGYRVRAEILKDKTVSGTVSASRDERILMGLFIDRYRVRTDTYSGTIRWRSESLRMDLTARRTETEEFGFRSEASTVRDALIYNLTHELGPRIRTDVRYRLQSYERQFTATTQSGVIEQETDLLTHDLTVINRVHLDNDQRATLRSTFRFHDRDGTQDLRTYYFEEVLQYRAARWMRPYIKGSVRQNEFPTQTTDTYRGEAGFDGDLFDSLNYHFDVHGTRTDRGTLVEDRYGFSGRLNYRKETTLGVLTANYATTVDQIDRRGIPTTLQIIDESITVFVAFPTFLAEPNVIAASIVVTDTNNLITYQEGFDYELEEVGNRTGIRVLPGGLLADGETVLVDYQADALDAGSFIAHDEAFLVRHDFERPWRGLALYARRSTFRTYNVDPGITLGTTRQTTHAVGLRQEWRDYAYSTEFETHDDDFGGYDRWRNQIEGSHRLDRQTRLGWNAGVVQTWFDTDLISGQEDRTRHLFAGAHVQGPLASNGFWRVDSRVLHDTGRTERTAWGVTSRLGYKWRRLSIEGGARFEQLRFTESDQDRIQLFVGLRHSLGKRTLMGGARR